MLWRAMDGEQVCQAMKDVIRVQFAGDDDRQTPARKLIDDRQHPEGSPVLRAILHEVIGPDMSRPFRPKADTGSVIQPQSAALGLFLRHFKPLPAPDAVNPLEVHPPA